MSYFAKILVQIRTTKGVFYRVSEATEYSDADAVNVELFDGLLAYPDPRVERFTVYSSADGIEYYIAKTLDGSLASWPAKRSTVNSIAYAQAPNVNLTSQSGTRLSSISTEGIDRDPNRVVYSETYRAWDIPASSAHYTGLGDDDPVLGFAVTTEPVSQGQYGQFPIVVLCRRSIHLAEVSASPFITGIVPVSSRLGAVGRHAFTVIGNTLYVATEEGIFALTPRMSDTPVSLPLHRQTAEDDLLTQLGPDTALGYFTGPKRDRRELWVAVQPGDGAPPGARVYALSLRHGKWFTMPISRAGFYRGGSRSTGLLYSWDGRDMYTEGLSTATVPFALETAAMDYGDPFVKKRIRRVGVRQQVRLTEVNVELWEKGQGGNGDVELAEGQILPGYDRDYIQTPRGHSYESYFRITGMGQAGQSIEALEVQYEVPHPHRVRR